VNQLPLREMTTQEIMADILNRLVLSGCWGTGHQDVDQLVNWMKSYVKENGRRVRKALKELSKNQYIGYKNNGRSIYLNKGIRQKIYAFIDKHLPE
jgi:hypothetical protein